MRKLSLWLVLAALAMSASLAMAEPAAPAGPVVVNSWDEAQAASRQYGTPILIDFYTDW